MSNDDRELIDKIKAGPSAPVNRKRTTAPSEAVTYNGDRATVDAHGESGEVNEGQARGILESYGLDPAEWRATGFSASRWDKAGGGVGESKKFTFVRIGSPADGGTIPMPDLDDLHAAVQRVKRSPRQPRLPRTNVCVLADFQTGKAGENRGGTRELLERSAASQAEWLKRLQAGRPDEIVLVDAGDALENFENAGPQERTNDLQLTEQIRVWRRIFWSWMEVAADYANTVKVISVPSNHGRVRRGKANLAGPQDDYGLEVLAQLGDMAAVHPDKYGHVAFYQPAAGSESLALDLAGGKRLGVAHGHQATKPDGLFGWLANQSLGRTPIGSADIVVVGHFHHLRIQTFGDDRWLFIAPTNDAGSDWFRNVSGNESGAGVLTFDVDPDGWSGLHVC